MDFGNSSHKKFQCFVCGEIQDTFEEFCDHIKTHELGREYLSCPLSHCCAPVRDLRAHFAAKHPSMPLPKNCQLRASVWYDQTSDGRKKKFSFAEGNFISQKNGGESMHYRSGWELQVYKILEEMGDVNSYRVEPFNISYYFNGKPRTYIPDLLINFIDGRQELWEIKPHAQKQIPQVQAKKLAAEDFCLQRGMTYKMITENEIKNLKTNMN